MRIDQVLPGAAAGDAITSMALEIREELRCHGQSDIYAEFVLTSSLVGDVLPLDAQLPDTSVDATIFHASYGRPAVTSHLLRRREPLILSFHNFSPAHHYLRYNPEFAVGLEWGEHDLLRFRDRFRLVFADSNFNADVLAKLGFEDVRVVALGLKPGRLHNLDVCPATARRIEQEFPDGFVLTVGQMLPHKRLDQVIATAHLVGSVMSRDIPFCVVGSDREMVYSTAVQDFARRLPGTKVSFWGSVSDSALGTLMRRATVLFGMSDHEGLCIPPLEAMTFGLPVLMKAAGAVPETVDDAAALLPADAGPQLAAEYIGYLWDNPGVRHELARRGRNRIKRIDSRSSTAFLIDAIQAEFQ